MWIESWNGTSLGRPSAKNIKIAKVWDELFFVDDTSENKLKFLSLGM